MTENIINDKLIQKIKYLIALSEDSSTTEHERNLALRRASELMLKYSIDIGKEQKEPSIIKYQVNILPPFGLDLKGLCRIGGIIGLTFGCYPFMNIKESKITLIGFPINCEICAYTIEVLINQGKRDCRAGSKDNPSSGYRISFWKGFMEGLKLKFKEPSNQSSEGLILYDKVKQAWLSQVHFVHPTGNHSQAGGFTQGSKSAQDARVNNALTNNTNGSQKLIK
jgi:hypothetical protein